MGWAIRRPSISRASRGTVGQGAQRTFIPTLAAALLLAGLACRQPIRVEEGVASFYADSFHGRETASGEVYNKRAFTAAHPTIAFGTRVKVVSLDNGRSAWVRINDRGPMVEGRIIDLSAAAARKLRFTEAGTAKVRLEIYD